MNAVKGLAGLVLLLCVGGSLLTGDRSNLYALLVIVGVFAAALALNGKQVGAGLSPRARFAEWKVMREGTPQDRRAVRAIRRDWTEVMYHSGLVAVDRRRPALGWRAYSRTLTRAEADRARAEGDQGRTIIPALLSCTPSTTGLRLVVATAPGQSVDDWERASAGLAMTWGYPAVRVHQDSSGAGYVVLDLITRDPLAETIRKKSGSRPTLDVDPVTIGVEETGEPVVLDLRDAWHLAIQGATRSGKSALCYGLLGSLPGSASVKVCGVDPSGVLLAPWRGMGHDEWIATGTEDMQHAADALARIVEEMDARIRGLLLEGSDKVTEFSPELPLLVVVLEEYPGTLSAARSEDDAQGRKTGERVAPKIERSVGRLVKEGAKVGVRVIVLAQRMSAKAIDTDDRSNFGVRISLRVDNADAVGMLHENATDWAPIVAAYPPGRALIERPGHGQTQMQVYLTEYADYRAWIETYRPRPVVPDRVPDWIRDLPSDTSE